MEAYLEWFQKDMMLSTETRKGIQTHVWPFGVFVYYISLAQTSEFSISLHNIMAIIVPFYLFSANIPLSQHFCEYK